MRVLFICTGNICRSPMGELLFRTYTQGTSLKVGSAGTTVWWGMPLIRPATR